MENKKKEPTIAVEFTEQELAQLSLSISARHGIVQTQWAICDNQQTQKSLSGQMIMLSMLFDKVNNWLEKIQESTKENVNGEAQS